MAMYQVAQGLLPMTFEGLKASVDANIWSTESSFASGNRFKSLKLIEG
jgi:hypothetical protein